MYQFIKRLFDIIFSLLLFPIFFLCIVFIGLAIFIEDKGPIFYTSNRIGKNKKIFKMYKFRSMKVDSPVIRLQDGSTFNSQNDSRLTKIGKFIRKTSLDEIPQLLNILKGDMSFVGPRPDSEMWKDNYTEEEKIIHTVRPGITGYNQVVCRNSVGTKEKLQNDIIYVKKASLWFDIKIMFLTVKQVFSSRDVYRKENKKDQN